MADKKVHQIREKWNYTDKQGNKVDYRSDVFSKGPKAGTHKHDWLETGNRGVQKGSKTSKDRQYNNVY